MDALAKELLREGRDHLEKLRRKPNYEVGVMRYVKLPRPQGLGMPSTVRVSPSLHAPIRQPSRGVKNSKAHFHRKPAPQNKAFSGHHPTSEQVDQQVAMGLLRQLRRIHAQLATHGRPRLEERYEQLRGKFLSQFPHMVGELESMEAQHERSLR